MAEAEHTLLTGIIFIYSVLVAHSRVEVTTDLAQPVKSGAEVGTGVAHPAKLSLHSLLDLRQPSVDRDEIAVDTAVPSAARSLSSACLLQLQIDLRAVSVVEHLASRRVGVLAVVVF
jgi:hypothetical protein